MLSEPLPSAIAFGVVLVLWVALWAGIAGAQATEWSTQLAALDTAARQGDAQAMTQLAQRYEHAEGVPRDYEKANALYCKAARAGYIEAQFKLGWCTPTGGA